MSKRFVVVRVALVEAGDIREFAPEGFAFVKLLELPDVIRYAAVAAADSRSEPGEQVYVAGVM